MASLGTHGALRGNLEREGMRWMKRCRHFKPHIHPRGCFRVPGGATPCQLVALSGKKRIARTHLAPC
eukprot:5623656-Alexandrium_andersonii.AAC.1